MIAPWMLGLALATAASPAAAPAAEEAKSAPVVAAGKDGFSVRSADGDFALRLRAYVHFDGRADLDDPDDAFADGFLMRRARAVVEGTVFGRYELRLMPDVAAGATLLQDAWVEARLMPAARLRAGKFKAPVGLERLQSATDTRFVERALPSSLVPNRDVGIQLHGELGKGRLAYAVGIFNGVADGASGDSDVDDGKEAAARLFAQPFRNVEGSPWRGLGVGIGASAGSTEGTPAAPGTPSFRTNLQRSFFATRADGTVAGTTVGDGRRLRLAPQAYWFHGPLGVLTEWVRSSQEVRRGAATAELENEAWQLALSWVLTGEDATYRSLTPAHPIAPGKGAWGAWEIAARVEGLDVDQRAFPVFANPASAARSARGWSAGINWYPERGVRWMLQWGTLRFDGGAAAGDRPTEKALLTRWQISF